MECKVFRKVVYNFFKELSRSCSYNEVDNNNKFYKQSIFAVTQLVQVFPFCEPPRMPSIKMSNANDGADSDDNMSIDNGGDSSSRAADSSAEDDSDSDMDEAEVGLS